MTNTGSERRGAHAGRRTHAPRAALPARLTVLRAALIALLVAILPGTALWVAPAFAAGIDVHAPTSLTVQADRPGVVFAVAPIHGIDLGTAAGIDAARAAIADPALVRGSLGAATLLPATGADATASTTALRVGAYHVREVGVLGPDGAPAERADGIAEFVVALPSSADTAPGGWDYTVTVTPKRSTPSITLAVADAGALVPGSVLTYTLTSTIPSAPSFYRVADRLDLAVPGTPHTTAHFLAFAQDAWAGAVDATVRSPAGARPLRTCPAPTAGCELLVDRSPGEVVATATELGRAALARAREAAPTAAVELSIEARVLPGVATDAAENGLVALRNLATVQVQEDGPTFPSTPVETRYGRLSVHKIDGGTGASLPGATFDVYPDEEAARARREPLLSSAPSDADGMIELAGLRVNDMVDAAPAATSYWLVETAAPPGYDERVLPVEARVLLDGSTERADATGGRIVRNYPEDESGVDPLEPTPTPGPGVTPGGPGAPEGRPGGPEGVSQRPPSALDRPIGGGPLTPRQALAVTGAVGLLALVAGSVALVLTGTALRRRSSREPQ